MPNERGYPRVARINEMLREVVADGLERVADADERIGLLTVTGVVAEPDLRHATVYLASLTDDQKEALATHRAELQRAIGTQARLKRTPQLSFAQDPAVTSGGRVEEILRGLHDGDD